MASVIVTPRAEHNLLTLIQTHSLPASTVARFRQALEPLHDFPLMGATIPRPAPELRFILGPWRWMIVIYRHYPAADQVRFIAVQDGRSVDSRISRR